jgi:hypothetical protein
MNDQTIENLLCKSPAPIASADLADQIKSAIRLPGATTETVSWSAPQSWFKRWLPAFSFALLLLSCAVVIGVQNTLLAKKQKANDLLRAQTADFDSLQQGNAEVQRLRNENAELERLQRDNAELQRLRAEMAQPSNGNLANLRAENERLKSAAVAAPADTNDFFAAAEARAERNHCINNLKQFGLAVRIWEGDNGNVCPTNVIAMTNELSSWKILQCPTDHSHIVSSWADVVAGNISYPYYGAGLSGTDDTQIIMAECPIHHNILLSDGSVQQLSPEAYSQQIKIVNGRKVYSPKK